MELDKLQRQWDSFPEVSLEERPVLSTDLEKMVVRNPLSDVFYLRRKLVGRIVAFVLLWLVDGWLLRDHWRGERNNIYLYAAFFLVLSYAIYFHVRLVLFADYPTLLGLPLVPFLGKLEIVFDKFIFSFKLLSAIVAFCLLIFFEQWMSHSNPSLFRAFLQQDWSKWLLLIFLGMSVDILLMNTIIPRYRKLMETVRKYRHGIIAEKARNEIWTIK